MLKGPANAETHEPGTRALDPLVFALQLERWRHALHWTDRSEIVAEPQTRGPHAALAHRANRLTNRTNLGASFDPKATQPPGEPLKLKTELYVCQIACLAKIERKGSVAIHPARWACFRRARHGKNPELGRRGFRCQGGKRQLEVRHVRKGGTHRCVRIPTSGLRKNIARSHKDEEKRHEHESIARSHPNAYDESPSKHGHGVTDTTSPCKRTRAVGAMRAPAGVRSGMSRPLECALGAAGAIKCVFKRSRTQTRELERAGFPMQDSP